MSTLTPVDTTIMKRLSLRDLLYVGLGTAVWLARRRWFQRLLRRSAPVLRLPLTPGRFVLVSRYEDVREVLARDDVFEVTEERIRLLNQPESFLLGMQRDKTYGEFDYAAFQQLVMSEFKLEDIQPRVARCAARRAEAVLAQAGERFNAVEALITDGAIAVCRDYYGVPIPDDAEDQRTFARWTFLISRWLFEPRASSKLQPRALQAAAQLNQLVLGALEAEKALEPGARDTILARLSARQRARAADPDLAPISDAVLRTAVVGMVMGFVPTNSMAGGHMLDVLLDQPQMLRAARAAALADDDERLKRCLFETLRFKPLSRDPLRINNADYTLADGTRHATRVRQGSRVLPLVGSAMFDEHSVSDPEHFDPDRPPHHRLLFGHGLHRCIGAPIAEAQLTQTLKPLLRSPSLRRATGRAGKLRTLGSFPTSLIVERPSRT